MKKIIKLTESDLSRIVKQTIKEQDEMEDMGIRITEKDIFNQVMEILDYMDDYNGSYNDDMREKVMDFTKEIMIDLRNDLSMVLENYITKNYDGYLHDILDNEGYDDKF